MIKEKYQIEKVFFDLIKRKYEIEKVFFDLGKEKYQIEKVFPQMNNFESALCLFPLALTQALMGEKGDVTWGEIGKIINLH